MSRSFRSGATRRLIAAVTAPLAVAAALGVPLMAAEPAAAAIPDDPSFATTGARFSLAVLPDTQFASRYATPETGNQFDAMYGSEPFSTQTQWIADNAATYGTAMTMHLGDIVDQSGRAQQWEVASNAMGILETAGHPYSILAGNHDVGASAQDTDPVAYDTYLANFSPERAAQNSTFVARDPSGAHEYHVFQVDGQPFLVMNLSWQADDAALAWASSVLDANPDVPTIVNSHQLINVADDGTTPIPTDFGERVWNQVIANHDQVFLTFNGHHHGAARWDRTNNFGNPVHQVLMDYQMAYMGGNGYMGLVEFDLTNGVISQTSFSPWVMRKPADTLVADDRALLEGAGQSFSIPFDFTARFPGLTVGAADDASATKALRDWIAANFVEPAPVEQVAAAGPDDYPVVEGTLAHWVMPTDRTEGEIAPVGATITDIAGGNDFARAPLNIDGVTNAQESDVRWSNDAHRLSANRGSVCFDNAARSTGVANFFTTADGAPINAETFPEGFTMETFIKISSDYTVEDNRWMQWLIRDGLRGNVPGYANTEPEEPPFAWAFSNLYEVQFSFVDGQSTPVESSAWSGEIVNLDEWLHLAVVNDPATKMTTMYIDGVPVLRNSPDTLGIGHDNAMAWILGAGAYDGVRQSGFLGCIGETRLIDGPTTPEQWLTARASDDGEPTTPPTTDVPTTTEPAGTTPAGTSPAGTSPAGPMPSGTSPATADGGLATTGAEPLPLVVAALALVALAIGLSGIRRVRAASRSRSES